MGEGKEGRRLQAAPKTRGHPTRKRVPSSSHAQQFQDLTARKEGISKHTQGGGTHQVRTK